MPFKWSAMVRCHTGRFDNDNGSVEFKMLAYPL